MFVFRKLFQGAALAACDNNKTVSPTGPGTGVTMGSPVTELRDEPVVRVRLVPHSEPLPPTEPWTI